MRKVLTLSLALILILGITSHGTSAYFSDTETSAGNTFTAWVGCPPGSLIIVSDEDTMVTEVDGGSIAPQNAVVAWQPYDSDNDHWDTSIDYTFPDGADWIWATYRVQDPVNGEVVRFERTFEIPCSPIGAELYITVDNGYTVWINGNLVGCAQVTPCEGWENYDLTEAYVHTFNWTTVEHYIITADNLVAGTNTLVILAANEHYDTDDGHDSAGTMDNNPAGLIYWLEVTWGDW